MTHDFEKQVKQLTLGIHELNHAKIAFDRKDFDGAKVASDRCCTLLEMMVQHCGCIPDDLFEQMVSNSLTNNGSELNNAYHDAVVDRLHQITGSIPPAMFEQYVKNAGVKVSTPIMLFDFGVVEPGITPASLDVDAAKKGSFSIKAISDHGNAILAASGCSQVYGPNQKPTNPEDIARELAERFEELPPFDKLKQLAEDLNQGPSISDLIALVDARYPKQAPTEETKMEQKPEVTDDITQTLRYLHAEVTSQLKSEKPVTQKAYKDMLEDLLRRFNGLSGQVITLLSLVKHVQSNHDFLVKKQKLLLDRPDLPLERVAAWKHYAAMKHELDMYDNILEVGKPLDVEFADPLKELGCLIDRLPPSRSKNLLMLISRNMSAKTDKPAPGVPIQVCPFVYSPFTGERYPIMGDYIYAKDWREKHGNSAWIFNPWTGKMRTPQDIGSDPTGLLII